MELAIGAARWVVGRALSPVTDGLLESWAACSELGPNVTALKRQLLYAQGMLNNARGREIRNPALGQLLLDLRHHAYNADDVLDELEYFRIQDELDGTYETTDDRGLVRGLVLNARHTARAVTSKLKIPSCKHHRKQKLKFDRVAISKRMAEIVEQLKPLCAMVSTILDTELLASAIHKLDLIASNSTTSLQGTVSHQTRNTTPQIIEPKLYGRDDLKNEVVNGITHGKYSDSELVTVLSIVGPGGLGKTTFTQHIYEQVKRKFQVLVWICVSQNYFSATRLAQEIAKKIPRSDNEMQNASDEELIETRLQSKRFLLVLDDIWTCHEDEWRKLLAPFKKGGTKGNMVIVTTRILQVAQMVTTADCPIKLERLEDKHCMSFFQACVFDDQEPWEQHTNLHDVGWKIVKKLKGFPLAVKTVGRLLKNDLTVTYWTRILESREWEHQASDNDIMPALKLSYNYLPFHLQQCFSHCALFPEDYDFGCQELIHLWIGMGLLGVNGQNKRIEDIGLDYLNDLVNHGFFEKDKKQDGQTYYVIHDLLHDLAVNVSAYECLSIKSSNVRSIQIPASIRHMSINIENEDVQDRATFENRMRDFDALGKRLKADSLRTLILFGDYHGCFCKPLGDVFREAKAFRVILLFGASYDVEDLLPNLSQLVHLRYLRIKGNICNERSFSSSIERLYNLLVLDMKECKKNISTREISNLVKLRHFVVDNDMCHSGICEVGKLKSIQELKRFEVKREKHGFELSQLGQVLQLQGSLEICNLEKVEAVAEVDEANLVQMHHLSRLLLAWHTDDSERNTEKEEAVLEHLKPHSNIREVCIEGHGGSTYPAWLVTDHSIENLECLCLNGVAWKSLPCLGDLLMVGQEGPCSAGQIFKNLKRLELVKISALQKWSIHNPFSHLEELTIRYCSELSELPFTNFTSSKKQQEKNRTMFPKLHHLHISNCEKLVSVPQIPWSSAMCSVRLCQVGTIIQDIDYRKNEEYISVSLRIDSSDCELLNVLAFSNLVDIKEFKISKCPPVPLDQLQLLSYLKTLTMYKCSSILWPTEAENESQFKLPVEHLKVFECCVTGKELAQLISYFPNLSKFQLWDCNKQKSGAEETEASVAEGLLLMPLQINELEIIRCPDVRLCYSSLQSQTSLTSLTIWDCPKILSTSSCSSSYCPFPTSLQNLSLRGVKDDMFTLTPLSNLTKLDLSDCECLRSEDIWHLFTQGHLRELGIRQSTNIFDCSEAPRIMQALKTDGESGNPVAAPIRGHFSSSLTELCFQFLDLEHFTREQSEALQMLASLQELRIDSCRKLQSLPAGLSGLRNLKSLWILDCDSIRLLNKGGLPSSLTVLWIWGCPAIRSLPKGTLPSSLMVLGIGYCSAFRSLPKGSLPRSLKKLEIVNCPAIRSLHKDSLPISLQSLNVRHSNEKQRRQCQKLNGTIPIVLTDD